MKMKMFKVPIFWKKTVSIIVKAANKEEAIRKAEREEPSVLVDDMGVYVGLSLKADRKNIVELEMEE